ncbi:ABC transporter ATP-binding protein [Aestuariispira insulae]|uniref:ABC-type iron transport system FetAB ATPase subunit n=1 Tax=Aestuariispira insulae TaxID=1461337 RepID=A0A3D9HPZ4_9PROT|nr:ATP-binding cassette domain-containing protein [Aestuariispira insulae]RED51583.1 ABC-type iron transport system FetAB ATPase subunit [Aestuariispira insulae]
MPYLKIQTLTAPPLQPASLTMERRECVTIQGPSGSGKSLFLRAIADLDPNQGTVQLDGKDRNDFTAPKWREQVGYLAAEPGWWLETARPHFKNPVEVPLAKLHLDKDILDRPLLHLSTGERQRLALLRAMEPEPSVLLLDEPTAALDPESTQAVEHLIRSFMERGGAILLVSHDAEQSARLADKSYRMEKGQLHTVGGSS